jgi:hypothetical protein
MPRKTHVSIMGSGPNQGRRIPFVFSLAAEGRDMLKHNLWVVKFRRLSAFRQELRL